MRLSIVVPCYNEEQSIPLFYREICRIAEETKASHQAEFEFIFVDDGCTDQTLKLIKDFRSGDQRVRYISFSRNFGKEAAMYAGLSAAKGDYVAILDADLQDPPSLLPQMMNDLLTNDYDCVAARRSTREGESPVRSFFPDYSIRFSIE